MGIFVHIERNMDKKANNDLPFLPPKEEIESVKILRKAIKANKALAKLNGYCTTIPNENILLDTIILKEARASSEIENIITTQDKIYQAMLKNDDKYDAATKDVLNYREATWKGYNLILKDNILITKSIGRELRDIES